MASTNCLATTCPTSKCCTPLTCENSGAAGNTNQVSATDFDCLVAPGKIIVSSPGSVPCASGACVESACCELCLGGSYPNDDATACSGTLTCANNNGTIPAVAGSPFEAGTCTDLGTGHILIVNSSMASTNCEATTCQTSKCCTPLTCANSGVAGNATQATSTAFASCDTGFLLRRNLSSIQCVSGMCDSATCCTQRTCQNSDTTGDATTVSNTAFDTTSTTRCPAGYGNSHVKTANCTGNTCTTAECCHERTCSDLNADGTTGDSFAASSCST